MNLYKISSIFSLLLFLSSTNQHVCVDQVTSPILVQRTLGQGSQGKAEEVLMNRKKYVLKTFLDNGNSAQNLREATMFKILSLADTQNQNVVKYELCFKKEGHYQLLMQYFSSNWDSAWYRSRIKEQSEPNRAKIYKSLIEKVYFMHQQGVLHCDLKPDNIFCDANDISNFRLGDFGLSKYKKETTSTYKCSAGALGYIAPETNKSGMDPVDAGKYDMFSIGIIIAQVETDRSCDILEASKELQNTIFETRAYNKFLQYVEQCLPRSNTKQLIINKLIIGLLVKDESQRLNEQASIEMLDQVINGSIRNRNNLIQSGRRATNDFSKFQQPKQNSNMGIQMNQRNISNGQFFKQQQQLQQAQRNQQLLNEDPYGANQNMKPPRDNGFFKMNGQQVINQQRQIPQRNNLELDQQKKIIPQNNFFNQQNKQAAQFDKVQKFHTNDLNMKQNHIYQNDDLINQQQKPPVNKFKDRQYLLAKRNRSNDIWGVMNQKNKFLI